MERKIHHPTLYVVANRSNATFYAESRKDPFHFLKRLKNPKGRLAERKLVSDRPGRSFSSPAAGKARSGLEPRSKQHEVVAKNFARRIAANLEKIRDEHAFEGIVLVAEPHFLGLLRDELGASLRDLVKDELPREYAQGSDRAVCTRIQNALAKEKTSSKDVRLSTAVPRGTGKRSARAQPTGRLS